MSDVEGANESEPVVETDHSQKDENVSYPIKVFYCGGIMTYNITIYF